MELLDLLADGICHRNPARTADGAWICLRCTALYTAGLVGVVWAGRFRKLPLWGQLLAAGLLLLPVALDGMLIPWGSKLDLPWLRATSGGLAGLGSGLFMGSRAAAVVRWPQWLEPSRTGAPVGGSLAVATGWGLLAAGHPFVLDAATFVGLVVLCFAGTGWAWAALAWLVARRKALWKDLFQRTGLAVMAVMVPLELALVSVVPDTWKPGLEWIRPLLTALGLGAAALALLPATVARAHLPHDVVAEVAVRGEGDEAQIVAQYLYPGRRLLVISDDGGRTWAFRGDEVAEQVLRVLVFAAPDVLFAVDGVRPDVFRSDDGGWTWAAVGQPDGSAVRALAPSPGYELDGVVLAGTGQGLYRSEDEGETWALLQDHPASRTDDLATAEYVDGQVYWFSVVDGAELWISGVEDTSIWFEATMGDLAGELTAVAAPPDFAQQRHVWIGTSEGAIQFSPEIDFTFAATWPEADGEPVDEPIQDMAAASADRPLAVGPTHAVICGGDTPWQFEICDEGIPAQTPQHSSEWGHYRRLAADFDGGASVALAAWTGLMLSEDGGQTWDERCFLRPPYARGVAFSPGYPDDPRVFVGSYGGGLMVTPDGGESWAVQADAQEHLFIEGLTLAPAFPDDPAMFLVASRRLLRSADGGGTWQRVELPGVAMLHHVAPSPRLATDGVVFALGTLSDEGQWALDRSSDGGESWSTAWAGDAPPAPQIAHVAPSPGFDGGGALYAVQTGPAAVLRSDDLGQQWSVVREVDAEIAALWVRDAGGDDELVVATVDGQVLRSRGGGGWEALADLEGGVLRDRPPAGDLLALSRDPAGLVVSRDGGETWQDLAVPFGAPVLSVVAPPDPEDPTLVLTTHFGAFFSCDGDQWSLLDRLVRLEDTACDLRYEGVGWESIDGVGSGESVARTVVAGDAVELGFAGRGVRWLAARRPDRGTATVWLDGEEIGVADLAGEAIGPEVVFDHDAGAHGWHSLRIEVTGDGAVEVDALEVIRDRVDNGPGESYEAAEWCIDLTPAESPPDDGDGCCASSCDHDRTPASAAVAVVLLAWLLGSRMRR